MPIILPTTIVPATETNPKVLIIYGPPKVGKSSEIPKLPGNYLHVDTEDGTDYIASCKVKIKSMRELIELEQAIIASKVKYDFIAWDTIDKIEEWCEGTATEVYKASNLGANFKGDSVLKLERGAGYLWLRHEFNKYFSRMLALSRYTIFVGHIRDKLIVPGDKVLLPDGSFGSVKLDEVAASDLDLTGKVKSIACSKADAIGHIYRDANNVLSVSFASGQTVNCGSRCEHLKGKKFNFAWEHIYKDFKPL